MHLVHNEFLNVVECCGHIVEEQEESPSGQPDVKPCTSLTIRKVDVGNMTFPERPTTMTFPPHGDNIGSLEVVNNTFHTVFNIDAYPLHPMSGKT